MSEQCEMCNEVMTKCDFEYCDICPKCLDRQFPRTEQHAFRTENNN
jgi:predicted  nucleic acid-binding Zn-ribbon protein